MKTRTFVEARCRQGARSYPHKLPVYPKPAGDIEAVKRAMWRHHPGDPRIEDLQETERLEVPGFCKAATVYHTRDFAIWAVYE